MYCATCMKNLKDEEIIEKYNANDICGYCGRELTGLAQVREENQLLQEAA